MNKLFKISTKYLILMVVTVLLGVMILWDIIYANLFYLENNKVIEVTADQEYEYQLEFVKEQKKLIALNVDTGAVEDEVIEVHEVAKEELSQRNIDSFLRYIDYHTTFNKNLPLIIDYNIGGNGLDDIVNYAYIKTKDLPHPVLGTLGLELVKTWSIENSMFAIGGKGNNDEWGICQIRYAYHKTFIDSQEFLDPYNQIDYCVDIYLDWYYRARLSGRPLENVRSAWIARDSASYRFIK